MVGVFFIGGLSMIFMGILGEYLGKIFREVKRRPKYIVREALGFDDKE
jgi:dolichol-phosphate mannosyltransferase